MESWATKWKRNKESSTTGVADKLLPIFLSAAALLFILYPVLCLVRGSVLVDGSLSLASYRKLSGSMGLLWNSLFSSVLSAVLSTLLSVAVSLVAWAARPGLRGIFRMAMLLAMVSPPFVGSLSYIQLYGRRGWITHFLLGLSLNPYNWKGVVLMQVLSFTALNALFLVGMLERADGSILQAARDLGASPFHALRGVLLPVLRPGIAACLLLSFIRGLADFGTPIVIGGRFNTVAAEIYMQITGYADLSGAAALNMLIFIPSAGIFLLYRRLMKASDRLLTGTGPADADYRLPLRGFCGAAVYLPAGLFFAVTLLQYGCIFLSGFVKAVRGRYHFTLEHARRLWEYDLASLGRSVAYALIVGLLGTVLAILLAYYIERRKIPGRQALDFLVTIPYMIPGSCFGIGYILAFGKPPLKITGTVAIVILNMVFRQLPNATKICSASLMQIPYALEDASRDLGAGKLRVIRDVILPHLNQAFFTCFAYHFTSAMTTAGSILFLIQPGQKIAVFRLFDAINTGDYGVASFLAASMIVLSLAVNAALLRAIGRERRGRAIVYANSGTQ